MINEGVNPIYIRSITDGGEECVLTDEFGYYIGTINLNFLPYELLVRVVWCMEDIVMEIDKHLSKICIN